MDTETIMQGLGVEDDNIEFLANSSGVGWQVPGLRVWRVGGGGWDVRARFPRGGTREACVVGLRPALG
jgi:hypothetical protein